MFSAPSPSIAAPSPSIAALEDSGAPLLPDQNRAGMDINLWGMLPGQTVPAFGPYWRISATPKISTSALLSLIVLLILACRPIVRFLYVVIATTAAYFAVFSFVRAIFTSVALFLVTCAVLGLTGKNVIARVWIAFAATAGVVAAAWLAPSILYHLQNIEVISRMFLRGEVGLSEADVYRQLYRPWLWAEHAKLFWSSDGLMGLGSGVSASASESILNANQARSDSDSLLTRLLATYGLPSFALLYFFAERCYALAMMNDTWGVAMVAIFVWLMMTWGSSFHPSNGIFVLAFLIIGRGSGAFTAARRPDISSYRERVCGEA